MTSAALALYGVLSCFLLAIAGSTCWWMLYAWRQPSRSTPPLASDPALVEPQHSFSLLVPARHEETVLASTLERLCAIDHPDYEIVVVVGHDDDGTRRVAETAAAAAGGRVRVVVDHSVPKNKPAALNTGLGACRGEIVGVFDAEDEVSLEILRQVDAAFAAGSVDVVQAGVQLVTPHDRWFALRNCLEYLFWFQSRIHAHALQGFVPLGGNTVFVRRELLVQAGGWDRSCLAEDCELGIRLSSAGARIAVVYDAHYATREETPATLRAFIRQRTRWNQGYLQVLRRGAWRQLPTRRQRVLARYVLAFPVLQAISGAVIPLSVASIFVIRLPLLLAMFGFFPALMSVVVLVAEWAVLVEMRRSFFLRARLLDPVRLVLTTIPYQLVLAFAAVRACVREARGVGAWEKTAHLGTHRELLRPLAGEL